LLGLGLTDQAQAAKPKPTTPSRAQSLGAAAAAIDFCSRIDHENSARYDQAVRKLLPGVTQSELEKAKSNADYQAAYRTVESALGQLTSEEALAQCKASL
jgi:hypothetical protein